jgi:hypothetical protein
MLALAQPLGISTPLPATSLPLTLRSNGNDLTGYIDATTYALTDMGFTAPQQLSFVCVGLTASQAALLLAPQAWIIWEDQVRGVPLYQGFIKDVAVTPRGPVGDYTVTCNDLSEALDYGRPVISTDLGKLATTDQAQILSLIGDYCYLKLGAGGYVGTFQPSMPTSNLQQMTTLRGALDATLDLAGWPGLVGYVDPWGRYHTTAQGDVVAPYAVSDIPS